MSSRSRRPHDPRRRTPARPAAPLPRAAAAPEDPTPAEAASPTADAPLAPLSDTPGGAPAKLPPLTWRGRLALLAIGFGLVLAVEGACRLAGFGGFPPLWATLARDGASSRELLQTNPAAVAHFFAAPTRSGRHVQGEMRTERVFRPKPEGWVRVVVAGESSVQGFPFPRHLCFAAFLERELRTRHPGAGIEVVNVGMTAAASFVVREIVEQSLAALEPDVLVIYTGHNEFYGAFGVASMQGVGTTVTAMRALSAVRGLGLYQVVDRALGRGRSTENAAASGPEAAPPREEIGLIQEMAAIDDIRPGGPLHRAARRAFETNLRAMLAAAARARTPVVLATIVANEADVAPIAHWAEDRATAESVARAAREAFSDPALDDEERLARLAALSDRHPLHALPHHLAARVLARGGRAAEAADGARRAVDRDAMPWRAPSWVNDVLRDAAANPPGGADVVLVDVEHAFRAASGGGPLGLDLVLDHVHPSLEGQAMIGRLLADAVSARAAGLAPGRGSDAGAAAGAPPTTTTAAAAADSRRLERLLAVQVAAALFEAPPLAAHNAHLGAELRARAREQIVSRLDAIDRAAVARWNREAVGMPARARPSIARLEAEAAIAAGDRARAAAAWREAAAASDPFSLERLEALAGALLAGREGAADAPLSMAERAVAEAALTEARWIAPLLPPSLAGRHAAATSALQRAAGGRPVR